MLFDNISLKRTYDNIIPKFEILKANLEGDFRKLIEDEKINCEMFSCRIKEFPKFFEKVRRKKYELPFEENEDFCGFRIVSFYLSDLPKINKVISENFIIRSTVDILEDTEVHYFGYRSKHYVVSLKDDWLKYPKLKDLGDMKFEIQVRTLNMHSWSQASHGLDYKNEHLVPKQTRRKLFRASAFLEQADAIFEELRDEIDQLALNDKILTIHSLKSYLEKKFPDKKTEDYKVVWLFEEMNRANVEILNIEEGYEILVENLTEIEMELSGGWAATGAARAILDITSENYFINSIGNRSEKWSIGVLNWRQKVLDRIG